MPSGLPCKIRSGAAAVSHCSVSPSMIREAVEMLEKRRHRVPFLMLLSFLQSRFPVEPDVEVLKQELQEALKRTCKLGWIRLYADGSVSLSTLRFQATVNEFGYE